MTTPTSSIAAPEQAKCPYCYKPIEAPVRAVIIDRAWDSLFRKQYLRTQEMRFCSEQCANHYQMGCEG